MMNINVSRFFYFINLNKAPGVDAFLNHFHRSFHVHAIDLMALVHTNLTHFMILQK